MALATATDMVNALGEQALAVVADRDGDGTNDNDAVTAALARAESFANSYIRPWLPIALPAPPALVDAVVWVAYYYLGGERFSDYQRERYKDALGWLKDVQSGKASLGISPPTDETVSAGRVRISSNARVMTRASLGRVM